MTEYWQLVLDTKGCSFPGACDPAIRKLCEPHNQNLHQESLSILPYRHEQNPIALIRHVVVGVLKRTMSSTVPDQKKTKKHKQTNKKKKTKKKKKKKKKKKDPKSEQSPKNKVIVTILKEQNIQVLAHPP